MSTLEKAFLKAMNIESSLEEEAGKHAKQKTDQIKEADVEGRVEGDEAKPTARLTKDLVSSRRGISQMKDVKRFTKEELIEKRFVHAEMKDNQLVDRYRNIRTKLLTTKSSNKKDNFVTLVTSVVPSESSSMIAANLAAAFSLDEAKTTMLVEANVNRPYLNELFEQSKEKGLIDFLESDGWETSKVLHKTGISRLRFVPSGLKRENSAEYFTSKKMKSFVEELVNRYPDRYPIINAPSVIDSADTRILIELCEKVVLVVPYGKCSDEEVMQAALAIGEKKLAGVILDGF